MGLRRTPIRGPCAVSVRSQRAQLASQVRDYAHTRDIRYPSLGIPDNNNKILLSQQLKDEVILTQSVALGSNGTLVAMLRSIVMYEVSLSIYTSK